MQAERARILEMLRDGRVSVEQAEQLLDALGKAQQHQQETAYAGPAQPPHASQGGPALAGGLAQLGKTIANQVASAFGGRRDGRSNFSTTCLTKDGLARMEDGTAYTNFGHLTIADDVPEDLLASKISSMTNFGSVTGPENLVRLLEGRCDTNFGSFRTAAEDDGEAALDGRPKMSNLGKTILTQEQLEHMADGVEYENLGKLVVSEDVSEELLAQKIAVYRNLGKTEGPKRLLGVLQARCPENLGKFSPTGLPQDDSDDE